MITMKNNNPRLLLVTVASAAATLVAAMSTDVVESVERNVDTNIDANIGDGDGDDDDDGYRYYIPHEGNSTLSATFSIRVTPEHYYIFSWTILWLCFASAVAFGMHQIRLERRWRKHVLAQSASANNSSSQSQYSSSWRQQRNSKQHLMAGGSPSDPELGGSGGSNNGNGRGSRNYTRTSGRLVLSSSRHSGSRDRMMTTSASSASINSISNPGNPGDENTLSSGDQARATFRRLLLTAMISRTIAIPIQIYSDPLWVQLIADTFPVMAFATAWTWLVSFFVQLVGVALGTSINVNLSGTNANGGGATGPGGGPSTSSSIHRPLATIDTVIQITAFVVYAFLIISFTVFRRIAAVVLLYALLCCVYAVLLGMALYFVPRLLGLLLPGLGDKWHSPLALRLVACSSVCLWVFAAHTFCFARKVVQSTGPSSHLGNGPYWWFQYGALELFPGILFLALLHPKRVMTELAATSSPGNPNSNSNSNSDGGDSAQHPPSSGRRTPPLHSYHKRVDSSDSKSGARLTPPPSSSPLLQQQQHHGGGGGSVGSNPNKETTPLLASHSNSNSNNNHRYGGATTTVSGNHIDAALSIAAISNLHPQTLVPTTGSDRSTASS